ncbi:MAG: transcription antitermination factor NusB [Candidatus Komeilibacteria bacterium RIFCSPHIGHO2_01_FULL_52_14]|uniref:Transcription antitermination protein NusB n=1 Tax=Candidatus Komeilibacteria bacterium RIFCSPHIGHO2_01_FULL_52_14 TaxID=1798549 RepID=A0A1G2BNA4_9BACT|nr:MAG: transcription antitermination factor NusB [Candidatus Komeilibacteria bacterium RIFCSPHIGHO2_01_FULL_52_14]
MANRHLARTLTLQALFEWDFYKGERDIDAILPHTLAEFAPDFDDEGFSKNLLHAILAKQQEIDPLIVRFAPEWPLDQITTIDRNVLRIGVYELKFANDIPPKVAINEAIELAKTFGGPSSGKFINGVLGSIYKEMIQLGEKQSPESQGIKEISAGGLVYRTDGTETRFALILDAYNKWTFPKGHVDSVESLEKAAAREISEEIGITDLTLVATLGDAELKVHRTGESSFRKLVHYYLFKTTSEKITVPAVPELKDARWFSTAEAQEALTYAQNKEMFAKALIYITEYEHTGKVGTKTEDQIRG